MCASSSAIQNERIAPSTYVSHQNSLRIVKFKEDARTCRPLRKHFFRLKSQFTKQSNYCTSPEDITLPGIVKLLKLTLAKYRSPFPRLWLPRHSKKWFCRNKAKNPLDNFSNIAKDITRNGAVYVHIVIRQIVDISMNTANVHNMKLNKVQQQSGLVVPGEIKNKSSSIDEK